MIVLFVLQAIVLAVMLHRSLRLLHGLVASLAGCDARVRSALDRIPGAQREAALRALSGAAANTWLGELTAAALTGGTEDDLLEQLDVWRGDVRDRLYVLAGIGRLASVGTMMCAVIELSWGLMGGSGLVALQAGLPQQLAFRDALTSLALGFVTIGVYAWTRSQVRRVAGQGFTTIAGLARSLATSST